MENHSRATLGSKLSAVLVAAGSSVGLGNIWRFPYIAGENGGGAFLIIYLFCVLLMGLPLMIGEFSVGRATHLNAVGAYRSVGRRWSLLGYNGLVASLLIAGFYFVVSGWTAAYFVHSLTGELSQYTTSAEYESFFQAFTSDPWRPLIYTLLFILATHVVIALGVQKGVERSAKFLMPLLFVALIALSIHSIAMPGSLEGLKFFFQPDFSKVTTDTFLMAMGQAFFSLSIGLGTMVTYASYFKDDTDIRRTAFQVTILDLTVAVLAGVMIFPAVFSVGIEPTSGPSLVFITLPGIFNGLPLSMLWSSIFFLLLIVAALTSTISLHEAITVYLHEEWRMSRRLAACSTTLAMAVLAVLASLSLGVGREVLSVGGRSLFDALDMLTANLMLPIGGLFTSLFVGWIFDKRIFGEQVPHTGRFGRLFYGSLRFLLRWFCPLVMLLIFLYNLGVF